MADISEIYINYDNVPTTPMRRSRSGTGIITIPRNDSRNGLTIEADPDNTASITYQFTGGPNTNAIFELTPGGSVEFSRKKGNNPILACSVVCAGQAALIEEW